jgi:stage II sporulation protein D
MPLWNPTPFIKNLVGFLLQIICILFLYASYTYGMAKNGFFKKFKNIPDRRLYVILTTAAVFGCFLLSVLLHPAVLPPPPGDIRILPETASEDRIITVYDHKLCKTVEQPLEDYVFHALAGEMFASYEPEALKAQACAIRTYVVYKMEHGGCGKYAGADVCTDFASCLAYSRDDEMRMKWGDKTEEYSAKMRKAASDTLGEIITYEGEPINALFHSNAGGETEDVQNVFGGNLAYLKGVISCETADSYKYETEVTFAKEEFFNKLCAQYPDVQSGEICILSRYESGRVETMQAGNLTLSGVKVRAALGLNSAHFDVSVTGDTVVFNVIGYGHGVGLSQAGAQEMATEGFDYKAILMHYYTGVVLERFSDF